jgi:hypothetical protein
MLTLTDTAATSLDDLDLSDCVVGPDLVARWNGDVTLYRRNGHTIELVGVFDSSASAFAALDAFDAPNQNTGCSR